MADSVEQKIINAIVTRLQLINGTGLYLTSIGTRVEDSRTNWDQEDDLPAISVFQGTVTSEPLDDEANRVVRTMAVMIKAFLLRLDTPTLDAAFARKAAADIYRAFWDRRHHRAADRRPRRARRQRVV